MLFSVLNFDLRPDSRRDNATSGGSGSASGECASRMLGFALNSSNLVCCNLRLVSKTWRGVVGVCERWGPQNGDWYLNLVDIVETIYTRRVEALR